MDQRLHGPQVGITFEEQPFSDKTMNTLVNTGRHTDEILPDIERIRSLTANAVPLANEIVQPF